MSMIFLSNVHNIHVVLNFRNGRVALLNLRVDSPIPEPKPGQLRKLYMLLNLVWESVQLHLPPKSGWRIYLYQYRIQIALALSGRPEVFRKLFS